MPNAARSGRRHPFGNPRERTSVRGPVGVEKRPTPATAYHLSLDTTALILKYELPNLT